MLGHKTDHWKRWRNEDMQGDSGAIIVYNYCIKPGHANANYFQLIRRIRNHPTDSCVTIQELVGSSNDEAFTLKSERSNISGIIQ
jgi:hypothetical protein